MHRLVSQLQITRKLSDGLKIYLRSNLCCHFLGVLVLSPSAQLLCLLPRAVFQRSFLDALTFEMMTLPMLLPSGHYVDSSTLDKLAHTDALYGRPPTDPFTGTEDLDPCLVCTVMFFVCCVFRNCFQWILQA